MLATLEAAAEQGPFAAVTLWDVLEHIPHPDEMLSRLVAMLEDDGVLVVRVPDTRVLEALEETATRRLLAAPYLKLCHPMNPEEHPHHFTPESLERIAGTADAALRRYARVRREGARGSGRNRARSTGPPDAQPMGRSAAVRVHDVPSQGRVTARVYVLGILRLPRRRRRTSCRGPRS